MLHPSSQLQREAHSCGADTRSVARLEISSFVSACNDQSLCTQNQSSQQVATTVLRKGTNFTNFDVEFQKC